MREAERRYINGSYLAENPGWHAREGAWKAHQCACLLREVNAEPHSICDVGCGAGVALASLGTHFPTAQLTGFDIAPAALEIARQKHPTIQFKDDLTGHYDLLLVLDVLEHVEDCFGFARSLRDHADLMLFHIPLELTWIALARGVLMEHRRAFGHIHHFTKDTAIALLQDSGYRVIAWRYTPAVVDFAPNGILTYSRRAAFRIAPDASVNALGGYALLVAAMPSRDHAGPAGAGE